MKARGTVVSIVGASGIGAGLLLLVVVLNYWLSTARPVDISDQERALLSTLIIGSVIAAAAIAAGVGFWIARRVDGSPVVALALTALLLAPAGSIALGIITFMNTCEYNEGFPLPGDYAC